MKARIRTLSDARGFTLVELLVVILIVGILAMIALPAFLGQRTKGEDTEAQLTVRTAVTALATHHTDQDSYATTEAELIAIEPALSEASPAWDVTGTDDTFKVDETSRSGTTFTFRRAADGTSVRECSNHGDGLCRGAAVDGDWW